MRGGWVEGCISIPTHVHVRAHVHGGCCLIYSWATHTILFYYIENVMRKRLSIVALPRLHFSYNLLSFFFFSKVLQSNYFCCSNINLSCTAWGPLCWFQRQVQDRSEGTCEKQKNALHDGITFKTEWPPPLTHVSTNVSANGGGSVSKGVGAPHHCPRANQNEVINVTYAMPFSTRTGSFSNACLL